MVHNPYEAPTKGELKKKKEERDAITKKINTIIETAQRILDSNDGIKYSEGMRVLRLEINKHVLESPGFTDPTQDAHFLRGCMIKMGVLDLLLGDIMKDAKRRA